jgi:hypothetical protein
MKIHFFTRATVHRTPAAPERFRFHLQDLRGLARRCKACASAGGSPGGNTGTSLEVTVTMSTRYEVSYLNMWPSEVFNGRVNAQFTTLLHHLPESTSLSCHAFIGRPENSSGLMLRIELTTSSGAIAAQRTLKTGRGEKSVCAAIDSVFAELTRLAPKPEQEGPPVFLELAPAA